RSGGMNPMDAPPATASCRSATSCGSSVRAVSASTETISATSCSLVYPRITMRDCTRCRVSDSSLFPLCSCGETSSRSGVAPCLPATMEEGDRAADGEDLDKARDTNGGARADCRGRATDRSRRHELHDARGGVADGPGTSAHVGRDELCPQ